MSVFTKEIKEDAQYLYSILFENAKSEFEYKGTYEPIIGLHGVDGGWTKRGFREYMDKKNVNGVLTYFGELTNGIDTYVDKLNTYIEGYPNPIIVGFSAGGIVAIRYAEKYGWNGFKKIITIASPFFGSPPAKKLRMLGKSFEDLATGSKFLSNVREIVPPPNKVFSIFAKTDLKAPFNGGEKLNWETLVIDEAGSHGEIHSNYKLIESIMDHELGI